MELIKLFNLQGSLFIMILAGAVLKRKGLLTSRVSGVLRISV